MPYYTAGGGGGGGAAAAPFFGHRAGQWYCPPFTTGARFTLSVLDRMYFAPLVVPTAGVYDRVGWNVDLLGSGATVRVALFGSNPANTLPGERVYDGGRHAVTATGERSVTPASPLELDAGIYWGMIGLQAAQPATNPGVLGGGVYMGGNWSTGVNNLGNIQANLGGLFSNTSIPDAPPADVLGHTFAVAANCPIVALRRA